jgi:hypothetical protein
MGVAAIRRRGDGPRGRARGTVANRRRRRIRVVRPDRFTLATDASARAAGGPPHVNHDRARRPRETIAREVGTVVRGNRSSRCGASGLAKTTPPGPQGGCRGSRGVAGALAGVLPARTVVGAVIEGQPAPPTRLAALRRGRPAEDRGPRHADYRTMVDRRGQRAHDGAWHAGRRGAGGRRGRRGAVTGSIRRPMMESASHPR